MVNKKGWIRIVEAALAILLILGVILVLISSNKATTNTDDLNPAVAQLLDEISKNVTLRESVVSSSNQQAELVLNNFVKTQIRNPLLNYSVVVCDASAVCSLSAYPEKNPEVYSQERIISSTLLNYNPKKVRIYIWKNG